VQVDCDLEANTINGELALRRKIQGLLLFRLLLAVFFLLLTIIVQSRRDQDLLSAHLQPIYFFSCILFVFTIVGALSLGRIRNLKRFAYVQLFFDVGAVTVLIYLSGGVESLFSFLYMPVIICAAVLLYRRGSLLTAAFSSVCYGTLLDLQYFGWLLPLHVVNQTAQARDSGSYFHSILMNIAVFYLVAFMSGYLAEELQKSSLKIVEQSKDLRRLEVLHRNIVHSITSGLITIGPSGEILFCNNFAQDILGLRSEPVTGRRFSSIFPGLDPLTWPRVVGPGPGHKKGPPERPEIVYRNPLGEELHLGYAVSVLQNETGKWAGWIFIFQDLTQFKAMEEHLKRLERLVFAGRIAAEISHEIKNPLAAMSGAVQMLEDESIPDGSRARLMSIIHREIDRMNSLVKDFLWLAKSTHGPENVENVPVCDLIQEILDLLSARNRVASEHVIKTAFAASPISRIDPHHFRQIVWNLLVNALDAMPGGGHLTIAVGLHPSGDGSGRETRIDISDSGSGIPRDARARIFEPFFTTKSQGTGLGLSIVYHLVEKANGRIEVTHHEEPCGTTFSLFFPLAS